MVIIDSPIFTEAILPFLLVFVVIFAILQKSKILGDGKAQIDALLSLAIALILIGVPNARNFIVGILPWMVVGVVIMLVFLILYGFVAGDLKKSETWMKVVFGILSGIFIIGVIIYVGGLWPFAQNIFSGSLGGEIGTSILLIAVIIAVVIVALVSGKKTSGSGKEE